MLIVNLYVLKRLMVLIFIIILIVWSCCNCIVVHDESGPTGLVCIAGARPGDTRQEQRLVLFLSKTLLDIRLSGFKVLIISNVSKLIEKFVLGLSFYGRGALTTAKVARLVIHLKFISINYFKIIL